MEQKKDFKNIAKEWADEQLEGIEFNPDTLDLLCGRSLYYKNTKDGYRKISSEEFDEVAKNCKSFTHIENLTSAEIIDKYYYHLSEEEKDTLKNLI